MKETGILLRPVFRCSADSVTSFQIDDHQTDQTNCHADKLIPCKRFVIHIISENKQEYCQNSTLYYKSRTYLPAGLICKDPSGFKPYNNNTENKGCPVKLTVFSGKTIPAAVSSENKENIRDAIAATAYVTVREANAFIPEGTSFAHT